MKDKKINNKKIIMIALLVIGVISLTVGVTYAFFNYTRTGGANTLTVGRIFFTSSQGTPINLTNAFPISSSQAETDTVNAKSLTVTVRGDTDYNRGIEYLISASDVNVETSSGKKVPINLEISVNGSGLGIEETGDYYTNRDNYQESKYKIEYKGKLQEGSHLLVGYIAPNTTLGTIEGIEDSITIKAYLDASKIAISDTYNPHLQPNNNQSNNVSDNAITPDASCFGVNGNTITSYNAACGKDIIIPQTINGNTITAIGFQAFYSKNLTSVFIPDTVITIGDGAFDSNQLTNVVIPDSVTTIGDMAFFDNQLTNVVIPNSVTTIKYRAFLCNDLVSVTLGKNVNFIDSEAFGFGNTMYGNSNMELATIINNSGNSFNWSPILGLGDGDASTTFATGTYNYGTGTIEIMNDSEGYDGTTSEWVDGRTLLTTSEWNSLSSTGLSFKVRVEANEGIWVEKPSKSIESCPGCKYIYRVVNPEDETTWLWTTWNTNSRTPTQITSGIYDNYEELIATTGKNYFLGVKLNNNNEVTNAYACGVKDNVPFCIEGTADGSKYAGNQTLLQGANLYNNSCIVEYYMECGPWDNTGSLSAYANDEGVVFAGVGEYDRCYVGDDGYFDCSESDSGGE